MVNYENYRTDYEWENALINRVFLFQFINSYFALFYTAFVKGRIGKIFGYDDTCMDKDNKPSDDCMYELSSLMLSTLLTVQIASTLVEALLPYVTYWLLVR